MRRCVALTVLAILAGCSGTKEGPLGIPLGRDGVVHAGVASIDITPDIVETFTDLNGNHEFDGCHDDPTASGDGCDEPFDDVNGNGTFDAVWIGGYGPLRAASGVHDRTYARAIVLAQDEQYIAMVALDLVGLGSPRIHEARDRLVQDGFDRDRLMVSSSHDHQGPDSMGLWGDPYDLSNPITGLDEDYQGRVADAIEQSVRDAAADMRPTDLRVGALHLRDRDVYFTGARFGGRNRTEKMHGMIYDGRDPVVISDQLLVIQGTDTESGAVRFTFTNWSGHPEVRGSNNSEISADWVGVTREVLEAEYGGVALHWPECLGGMQSALNGDLPQVLADGTHVYQTCDAAAVADAADGGCYGKQQGAVRTDEDDLSVPQWAEPDSWDFVTSHGWHIGEAAIAALEAGEDITLSPLRVEVESIYVPVENIAYQILGPQGVFDLALDNLVERSDRCPEVADGAPGCIETRTFRAQLGPITFFGVPGELLPELMWGFPDDAAWLAEVDDPTARGDGSVYFPQHDHDCDDLDYADCTDKTTVGSCDCLKVHAWPYALHPDPSVGPLVDLADTEYAAAVSMTDNYLSYIIPEPDFNTNVSLLSDTVGDHYEDTVSPGHTFGSRMLEGQRRIADRWDEPPSED